MVDPEKVIDALKEVQDWESLEGGADPGMSGWQFVGVVGGVIVGALMLGAGVLW